MSDVMGCKELVGFTLSNNWKSPVNCVELNGDFLEWVMLIVCAVRECLQLSTKICQQLTHRNNAATVLVMMAGYYVDSWLFFNDL